ncbi:MAG: hypothetical protein NC114_06785 [Ruminococcus flavefaciens]|nr:hypothetical protein [Ruminococcus flavefaciens]
MRPDKLNDEGDQMSVEEAMLIIEKFLKIISDRFDGDGVLKPEYGGTGDDEGIADTARKLLNSHTFITNLASAAAGKFDGTQDVSLGVTGVLSASHGGTGVSSLAGALYKFLTEPDALTSTGLAANDYVGIADVSGNNGKKVTIQDLATFIATLITTKPYMRQNTAPANTEILWIDSGNSDIVKYYNGTSWVAIKTAWA